MNHPLCCVASGSGGHIIPCITFAKQHAQHTQQPLLFIGNNDHLDTTIKQHYTFISSSVTINIPKVPYANWWKLPFFMYKMIAAFFKSLYILYRHKPTRVISTGGYLSIPVCLAAFCLRIPIDLFELNAEPGRTIQCIAPLATQLFICFKETQQFFKQKALLTTYPLRFTQADKRPITPKKPTLLILGGSQGSAFLNTMFEQGSVDYLQAYTIIHQAGVHDKQRVEEFYARHGIDAVVFAFHHQLADYYNQASLIICRAGAGTIFETLFFEKPCIIIPLTTNITAHQKHNAYAAAHDYPELVTVLLQDDIIKNINLLQETIQKKLENRWAEQTHSSDLPNNKAATDSNLQDHTTSY